MYGQHGIGYGCRVRHREPIGPRVLKGVPVGRRVRVSLCHKARLWLGWLGVEISDRRSSSRHSRCCEPNHELVRCMHEEDSVANTRAWRELFAELDGWKANDTVNVTTQPGDDCRIAADADSQGNTVLARGANQGTTMIGAPAERDEPTNKNEQEYDLPLRPNSDSPVRPYQDSLDPNWDRPEVDFTEVEYEYEPKMGTLRVAAYVSGIAVMAVVSLWLVAHARERRPFGTWTLSAPDLSDLSMPKVPEELKRLPGELATRVPEQLAKVPAETKRLIARASEAVAPPPAPVKTPPPPARSVPPPVAGTPAPATLPVPPGPRAGAPPTSPSVTSTPPVNSAPPPPTSPPPRVTSTTPPPTSAAPPVTSRPPASTTAKPPVTATAPPVAPAPRPVTPPPAPVARSSPASAAPTPAPRTTQPPSSPPRVAAATPSSRPAPATSASSRPATAPSTRPLEPLTVSANPTPTQRAAAAAAAAASPAAPRPSVEDAPRPPSAPPAPADIAPPPPPSADVASATAAPPAAEPGAASAASAPSVPVRTPTVEADSAIRDVLGRYRTAFNVLDARAASDVWPTLDQQTLNRAFAQLSEQNVSFDQCAIDVKGVLAQARCTGTIRFVPKIGSRAAQVEPRRWDFTLRKAYSGWVIHEVRAR